VIRVLVVEDSVTVRRRLVEVLASDPEIEVAGEAHDGKQAIERCRDLRPDVITMDMMLPVMSGLAATEYIMAHCPTPILIVSSSTNRGELFKTYEALAAGAVDVLEKPGADDNEGAWETRFLSTLKIVSRIKVITRLRARLATPYLGNTREIVAESRSKRSYAVVGIGASTGGPGAVVQVLHGLPADFPFPILLVLHIGEPFGRALAEWLEAQIGRRVAYAEEGESILAAGGRVIMAPPGRHLTIRAGRARLTLDPERHSCRPSVDVLFESIASEFGAAAAACLLTGMGRDGAAGLLRIHRAGGLTIAQDEATSVVYGMPREAVLLGAASQVLPLGDVGPALASLTLMGGPGRRS
jgi:two-component system, chemotaxis family, protein-glutamate methylesterase/glutaminase